MELQEIVILAVIQGITEFLPISSSGHLVIAAQVLHQGNAEALDVSDVSITLHLGTLVAILAYYARRIWQLLAEDRRVVLLLAVGTLPAVAVGLTVKFAFESALESPLVTGIMLVVTGVTLLLSSRLPPGARKYQELTIFDALLIGTAQAAAVLPGLSRSGSTICAGMARKLSPESAATFSFLLAIPVILAAGMLEVVSTLRDGATLTTDVSHLAIGAAVAAVVGWFSLKWLVEWVKSGRLWWFALWCIPLGIVVIWSQL